MDQHGAAAPPRPAKIPIPGRAARVVSAPRALVSLTQPRPESERQLNAYVETPPKNAPPTHLFLSPVPHQHRQASAPTTAASATATATANHQQLLQHQPRGGGKRPPGAGAVVSGQPAFSKRAPFPECRQDSIICPRCRRCKCTECARPRPLPSRWVGDSCLCSAETAIDYTSCMCCAKALFYHCCDGGGDGAACADDPCSCTGSGCPARWGCLAALALVLPCLLCYWPLRGLAAACAGAYAHTGASGCRCKPGRTP